MPTQIRWRPPVPLSPAEQTVARKLTRIGKFYVFLREVRAELFDEAFQAELAAVYQPRETTGSVNEIWPLCDAEIWPPSVTRLGVLVG